MDNAENDNAAPEGGADSSGDFGEGIATLEQRLLDSLPKEDEDGEIKAEETATENEALPTERSAVEKAPPSSLTQKTTSPSSLFDLNGRVSLKVGDKVSADHVKELERGWLREADYTRKTQELAKVRKEAEEVLKAQEDIVKDPRNIFKFIPPQQILSAFTRQEMLAHGLHAGGVTPQVWNRFLEWYQQERGNDEPDLDGKAGSLPKADPYTQQLSEFSRRIEAMERAHQSLEEQRRTETEKRAYEEQMSSYDREVEAALKDFPAVNKRALLVEMAASDGSKTIRELAEELNSALETRFQEYLKTKTTQKQQATVKAPRGTAVPVLPKRPQTFDEADAAIAKMYGDGSLRGGVPFGG